MDTHRKLAAGLASLLLVTIAGLVQGATFDSAAINAGGTDYVDSGGLWWMPDGPYSAATGYGYTGWSGNGGEYGSAITGTVDDPLWRVERSSGYNNSFSYRLDVPNGAYTVDLLFCERWSGGAARKFDVSIEGTKVLDDYSPITAGLNVPITKTYGSVTVADGHLDVFLTAATAEGGGDQAMISGLRVTNGTTPYPTRTWSGQADYRFDCGNIDGLSPLNAGYTRIFADSIYHANIGYGWVWSDGSPTPWNADTRTNTGVADALLTDCLRNQGTWDFKARVPNGSSYGLIVYAGGDGTGTADAFETLTVTAEGSLYSISYWKNAGAALYINGLTVADGAMDITFGPAGWKSLRGFEIVPEPGVFALLAAGLAGLLRRPRRGG